VHFNRLVELGEVNLFQRPHCVVDGIRTRFDCLFRRFVFFSSFSHNALNDLNSHASRSAFYRLDGRFQTCGIQIGELQARNIFNLLQADGSNLVLIGFA
jgi:hypothetical protein